MEQRLNKKSKNFKPSNIGKFMLVRVKERWLYAIIGVFVFWASLFIFGGWQGEALIISIMVSFFSFAILLFTGKQLHWDALMIIIFFGIIFCLTTPILDTPDETAHLARAMYVAEGNFFVSHVESELTISQDYGRLHEQAQKTILENDLNIHDSNIHAVESNGLKATNAYAFISYLPQAFGIGLGRLINFSVLWSFYLGRITNLLFYAVMISLAIKLTPVFKQLFFVVGTIPMGVYIAASYNQDSFGIGMILVTIAYFLYLSNKEDHAIRLINIVVYMGLCMLITLSKFPFVLLILLPVFISPGKFDKRRTYLLAYAAILITAVFAVIWMKSYSAIPHPFLPAGANMQGQVKFLLSSPIENFQILGKNIFEGLINYLMLFNFGWLSYSSNGLGMLYAFFFGAISVFYPRTMMQNKLTRLGSLVVLLGIYVAIELSMYLTWTPVGLPVINGVQGRYFIGLLPLLPLVVNIGPSFSQINPIQAKQYQELMTIIPVYFLMASLALTLSQYY